MTSYTAATEQEIALVLNALALGEDVPDGFAYNPGWPEIIRKVDPDAALPNPAYLSRLAADARYARRSPVVPGPKLLTVGSSIENRGGGIGSTAPTVRDSRGYVNHANVLLGHRFDVTNRGIGGETTAGFLARIEEEIATYDPDWILIGGATNDGGQGVPAATSIANYEAMLDICVAAGLRIILIPTIPNAAWDDVAAVMTVRDWMLTEGPTYPYTVVVDVGQAIADPATDWAPVSGMLEADGTHQTATGASRMGATLFRALDSLVPMRNPLRVATTDNLLSNGGLVGSGSTIATGWSATGTPTISYVNRDDIEADWMQMVVASSSALTSNVSIGADLAVGEAVETLIEVEWDGLTRPPGASQGVMLTAQCYNGSSFPANGKAFDLYRDGTYPGYLMQSSGGVLRTPPLTIPTGTTLVQFFLTMNGAGTYRVGRAMLRKVE